MVARLLAAAFVVLAVSPPVPALELLAPAPACALAPGRVVVIGRAAQAERGTVEWSGGSTSFRVREGRFTVALNLDPGAQKVIFRVGDEVLEASWKVGSGAEVDRYVYHPKTGEGECAACHEPGQPPAAGENVSARCYTCHTTFELRRFVHGPTAMGLCTACHDPHGSLLPAFLRFPEAELCTYCHNQPVTQSHRKDAGDARCTSCHDPHGTNRPFHVKTR